MTRRLTPPELACILRVDVHTVLDWIRSGQLRAVNVGSGRKRPRWRIDPADVTVFEASRTAQPQVPTHRRKKAASGWTFQYF
jgi:excisionase family DNA binding protein